MKKTRVMIDYDTDRGYYKIQIRIPDGHGTYDDLKRNLLTWSSGGAALNALDIARTIIQMELDYPDTSPGTTPFGGNGDKTYE